MTITEAPLDRQELFNLEPSEYSETSSSSIPSSGIPNAVLMTTANGLVQRIEFRYPSSPLPILEPVLLDDIREPAVSVAFSEGIRWVVRLQFSPAIPFEAVRLIAPRLRKFAESEVVIGKRLSLQLIAAILESSVCMMAPQGISNEESILTQSHTS